MSKNILDIILNKPIESLVHAKKPPPSKEALKLYREILQFSKNFYWNNNKGENWCFFY